VTGLAITRVTVIDVAGASHRPDTTVVVSGNHIAAVGPAKELRTPKGARVIDGAGRFLIPGLWDMHWHSLSEEDTREVCFPLAVANGVTGVRDMFADCLGGGDGLADIEGVNRWRQEAAAGRLLAPRIVAASQIVDGVKPVFPDFLPVGDAAEARRAVRTFKQRGVDFIKIYSLLGREAFFALAEEAKVQGLPFAGHLPIYVRAREASDAGQRSIEHLDFGLAYSTREEEIMQAMAEEMHEAGRIRDPDSFALSFYRMLDRSLIEIADTYDAGRVAPLVERFTRNGTWFCPTLVLHRADAFQDESEYTHDERLKYVPEAVQEEWAEVGRLRRLPPPEQVCLKRAFSAHLQMVGAMRHAGARFLAGTDVGNGYLYPGFSLHDELALLVEAGFTPLEALQTATIHPAEFLGWADTLGTIEPGKLADLALLEADPLEDIRNTRRITAVVVNGRLLERDGLDELLGAAAAAANGKD
jgi:hypothetical protein